MALPVILINSATGSDTAASGAGPATAVTGTGASTDVAGTTVTVDAGSVIAGVATDGSAALYLADATAGHRNFAKITGSAGSGGATPTFTVAEAFTGSLSGKSWAVGGKRATIGGTNSVKLIENNAAAGDAMPGWIMEMESGHAETLAAAITTRRSGDQTSGRIRIRGSSGAAVLPLLTWTNNGNAWTPGNSIVDWSWEDFEMKNSNATKTASTCFTSVQNGAKILFKGIKANDASNKFWRCISAINCVQLRIKGCKLGNFASSCISNGGAFAVTIEDCEIDGCGADAISMAAQDVVIRRNVIVNTTGIGILFSTGGARIFEIEHNTIDASSSDAIKLTGNPAVSGAIRNNQLSNSGGYGLNFSTATAAAIDGAAFIIENNNGYNNALGNYNPAGIGASDPAVDPGYVSTSGKNWGVSNALILGMAAPATIGKNGLTLNYSDIGAAQHAPNTRPMFRIGERRAQWVY